MTATEPASAPGPGAFPSAPAGAGSSGPDLRLFVPAMVGWLFAAGAIGWPPLAPAALLLGGAGLGALLLGLLLRRGRAGAGRTLAVSGITLALVLLLAVRVLAEREHREHPALRGAETARGAIAAEAIASGYPRAGATGEAAGVRWLSAVLLRVEPAGPGGAADPAGAGPDADRARVPVLLRLDAADAAGLGPGSGLSLRGQPRPLGPGDGAASLIEVRPGELRAGETAAPFRVAQRLRGALRAAAAAHPGWGGQLIPGLAIGDTTPVSGALDGAMKQSSLTHLIAVSGANCAVITGLVLAAAARIGVPGRARVAGAAAALAGFVLVVGPEPSVLRAGVMAAVVLAGLFSGRPAAGVPALGVAVAGLLAVDPWQARNAGFALSVLATAGILLGARPLGALLARAMPGWLTPVFSVPIAAQLACQPLLILLQPSLPTLAVPANVLAAPAAPAATVLGLAACALGALWAPLGEGLVWLALWPASWIAAIAEVGARVPGAQLPWPPGWPGVLLLAACEAALLLAIARLRRGRGVRGDRGVWGAALLGGAAVGAVLAVSVLGPQLARAAVPAGWLVFACDIGQGDAVLLRGSAGAVLVDTGDDEAGLLRCLELAGVRRIALLMLSHDDRDHVGALPAILHRVDAAVVAPSLPGTPRPVLERLRAAGVPHREVIAGAAGELGDLSWEVLWPDTERFGPAGNEGCLAARFRVGGVDLAFLCDLGEGSQRGLLRAAGELRARIVKVAHHGSADQLEELYLGLGAELGVVSVGPNPYGHPTARLLDLLDRSGTRALRTDELGCVAIRVGEGDELRVWSERRAEGRREPAPRPRGGRCAPGLGRAARSRARHRRRHARERPARRGEEAEPPHPAARRLWGELFIQRRGAESSC